MATKRNPATAAEVTEYFETADLAVAQMVMQLVTRTLKNRAAAVKAISAQVDATRSTDVPTDSIG